MDLEIIEGADYLLSLHLTEHGAAMNLTGYQFEAQIRADYRQDAPLIAAFTVTIPDPANGEILLSLVDTQTLDLLPAAKPGQGRAQLGVYDVFMISPDGGRSLLHQGRVRYRQTITRSAP